tara:strand:- start:393258 stop:393614 length:357 start_codon:yes stop_codon:yes gene_type:complete
MKFLLLYSLQDYLIIAYGFMAAIAAFGYGPQIWTLIKSTGRSMSTPISTWVLWSAEAVISFSYAAIVLQDLITSLVFGFDALAALTICGLTVYNRHYRFAPKLTPEQVSKTYGLQAAE